MQRYGLLALFGFFLGAGAAWAEGRFLSHPPLRTLPPPARRPLPPANVRYVDPVNGKNDGDGGLHSPWRTINHALRLLKPGDTLCLRGGLYHENVYCAVAGRTDAPITIRGYPGERAILDGGLPEFHDDPANAWTPYAEGAPGEYRSTRPHRNLRDVVGLFGDSNVGLQTYWHAMDLRADNELWIDDPEKKIMVKPVYCGPGLWYDKQTGYVHCRLAHTHLNVLGKANYRGETDPRKLPLVIAPFNSVPLFVDQAMHVRFQDLVIRGGGFNSVVLQQGVDLEFDNVVIFCGSYGLRSRGTGPLRFVHSAIHGMIPPWAWRTENSLFTYTPRYYDPFVPPPKPTNERNVARLPTHAVLVTEGSYEFEIFYYPHNHDWEIAHSEFTDGHDGVYLSGSNVSFHHNVVDHMQDDGIYLSSPSPFFNRDIRIYQNLMTRILTAFACNSTGGPGGTTYIYRNVVDQREPVPFDRPSPKKRDGAFFHGHVFLTHGSNMLGIEAIHFYQNTFLTHVGNAGYAGRTWVSTVPGTPRRVFNNLCVYLNHYPDMLLPTAPAHDLQIDGNLHWCPLPEAKLPANFLEAVRHCPASEKNRTNYPPGWAANDLVADPRLVGLALDPASPTDYRLRPDSPAVGKGIVLPTDYPDPLRPAAGARPDIGALPHGAEPPRFGRHGRIALPIRARP
jgi:hypothetical protein